MSIEDHYCVDCGRLRVLSPNAGLSPLMLDCQYQTQLSQAAQEMAEVFCRYSLGEAAYFQLLFPIAPYPVLTRIATSRIR